MNIENQTVDKLIESFKEAHNTFNIHNNPTIVETLSEIDKLKGLNTDYASALTYSNYIKEQLEKNNRGTIYSNMECPFFIPEEVEQLKNYYSESGTESYNDYFDESGPLPIGKESNSNYSKSWNKRIMELQNQLTYTNDPEESDKIKQNLIDLGWNPEIEYTAESQFKARERYNLLMSERMCKTDLIDIQSIIEKYDEYDFINEANVESLYPVSIVLVRGKSFVSPIISKVTKSDFTHSALALDGDFNRLYSFNFDNKMNIGGGFSLESVRNYPQDSKLGIYTFFVKKDDYDKLQQKLQELLINIKNTSYSVFNLITYPAKLIKNNTPDKMICSQFVDSCMKLINIDITNIDSSKVSPNTLYKSSISNAKIYKTYEGKAKDFNSEKTSKFLSKLSKSAKPMNESGNIGFFDEYISPVVVEARKIPIEIKNNGDVLLTNPFPDFDAEYMASHKLLMQYNKANNIEPMKYELARLYYMNYILEKKLYHNHFINNKEKNMKTRARVLNDFNKYIKVVLKAQPEFNFAEYYEQSPFYPNTVEVKGSTINKLKDVFSYIL